MVDITPPPVFIPFVIPETAPQFNSPPDEIEISFDYERLEPIEIITYSLPGTFDMNSDPTEIIFTEANFAEWSHFLTFDGLSTLTLDCNLLTKQDVDYLVKEESIELPLFVVDSKGYTSKEYTLEISFEIEMPEIKSTFAGVNMADVDK